MGHRPRLRRHLARRQWRARRSSGICARRLRWRASVGRSAGAQRALSRARRHPRPGGSFRRDREAGRRLEHGLARPHHCLRCCAGATRDRFAPRADLPAAARDSERWLCRAEMGRGHDLRQRYLPVLERVLGLGLLGHHPRSGAGESEQSQSHGAAVERGGGVNLSGLVASTRRRRPGWLGRPAYVRRHGAQPGGRSLLAEF